MKHFCDEWVREWCNENGWTDLFIERRDYWAFPPHGVIPLPIPKETLIEIKAVKGFSPHEKIWLAIACSVSLVATILTWIFACPMPLVFAFAFGAVTSAKLEID
jgi:hypothetical protein